MTMDMNHRRKDSVAEVHINVTSDDHTEITPTIKTNKRSFDVAFLMLPDDKLKQKQLKASKQAFMNYNHQIIQENEKPEYQTIIRKESPLIEDAIRCSEENKIPIHSRIIHNTPQKPQIFDDPSLGKPKVNYEIDVESYRSQKVSLNSSPEQKSAFTKVNMISKDSRLSPNLSMSPDLSYQNSLSPSPPIINRQYQNFPPNILTPNQIFKSQNVPAYHNNFIQENLNSFSSSPSTSIENPFLMKAAPNPELLQPNFAKMRPILQYRPEMPYSYPTTFQPQDMLKIGPPDIRHPAAAILTSLLPPSFAALSLPAQNVCAKCNISFRMTSDLVYHMRSHHKSDVANDMSKRRREEKLKCPVCSESFRERHHLTRHMTAHQDKEGDSIEPDAKKKSNFVNFSNK